MTSCRYEHSDGAYVLGALSPPERTEYENHLDTCPACAAAVARLAPVPGLLSRADPAALSPEPPEPARLPRLLAAVAAEQRRRAWGRRLRLAAASLAAAVLAAVATAVVVTGPAPEPPAAGGPPGGAPTWQMQPVAGEVPVVAEVATVSSETGTEVWLRCGYPDADYDEARMFRLVAVGSDGTSEQVGSWWAGPGEELTLTGVTGLTDDLLRLDLRDADNVRLLTYEVD